MDRPTVVLRPSRRANVVDMTASDLLGGRYELRGVLGRGGMAEVRDGWDTRLHRAVAIKLLHPGLIAQADTRMRFAAEARSAAALSHPNVVAVHDSGEHHGTPLIVMMRLSGRSLADYLTPERIAGRRATVSDDLYALGVVGYEALTGRRPFPQQNLAELAPGRLPSNRRLHSPCCGRTWIRVWRKRSNGPWRVTRSGDSAAPPLCAPRSPAN